MNVDILSKSEPTPTLRMKKLGTRSCTGRVCFCITPAIPAIKRLWAIRLVLVWTAHDLVGRALLQVKRGRVLVGRARGLVGMTRVVVGKTRVLVGRSRVLVGRARSVQLVLATLPGRTTTGLPFLTLTLTQDWTHWNKSLTLFNKKY